MDQQGRACDNGAVIPPRLLLSSAAAMLALPAYALGVEPQDFHAVAEVFVGGEWHLFDPTGMAKEANMAKIGIGRDAADVAFLTSFGPAVLNAQTVEVTRA